LHKASEDTAIEKLFEDVHRRDRVFLDAAFELKVDQVVSEPVPQYCGIAALFAVKKGMSKS
jgi:hypothetical protein